MNWKATIRLLGVPALLAASAAHAQAQAPDATADCPALSSEAQQTLTWVGSRFPNGMVFCRAIRIDDASDAFAVTIGSSSPFKPRRPDRAEEGTFNGAEVQWYRGVDAGNPSILIRETLLELPDGRVAHIFIRTDSAERLAQYQQQALLARF